MGWKYTNLFDIRKAIGIERERAKTEARESGRFTPSRGTFLATADRCGDQCLPRPEAECPTWHGTLKEIRDLIEEIEARYPQAAEIYIAGGYDASASPFAYRREDYEPWAGAWHVTIWTREGDSDAHNTQS